MRRLKLNLGHISGHYPKILGRLCFDGIGKNVSKSLLSQSAKHAPNAQGLWHVCDTLSSRAPEKSLNPQLSSDLKIANFGLFYTRQVLQNKHIVTLKDTKKDCWLVGDFSFYKCADSSKQKSQSSFYIISLKWRT